MAETRDPREITRRAIPVVKVTHEEAADVARKVLAGEVLGTPGMMKAADLLARYVVDLDEDLRGGRDETKGEEG
jgi:hypothetical protein